MKGILSKYSSKKANFLVSIISIISVLNGLEITHGYWPISLLALEKWNSSKQITLPNFNLVGSGILSKIFTTVCFDISNSLLIYFNDTLATSFLQSLLLNLRLFYYLHTTQMVV